MAEYIEREIAEKTAIDTVYRVEGGASVGLDDAMHTAMCSIPAADVVEVVRCKDCRYFQPYEGEEHKGDCAELVGLESCVYEDDFCSYAERKDGKGEGE